MQTEVNEIEDQRKCLVSYGCLKIQHVSMASALIPMTAANKGPFGDVVLSADLESMVTEKNVLTAPANSYKRK
jgi:hypothetical protein